MVLSVEIKLYYVIHLFQTNFVRQKTPHPKELKAKAHKLFNKRDSSGLNDHDPDHDQSANGEVVEGSNGHENGDLKHQSSFENGNEESEEVWMALLNSSSKSN